MLVERKSDRLCRLACGIVAEDAPDDLGLSLVYGSIASDRFAVAIELLYDVITVGIAAARFAGFHAPALTSSRLVGQVLEEKRVHRALQADMQVRDLAL
ncbi:hypothetical protein WG926_21495 [Tistrella sp. BH-R2-4]|uniref:Uncharacterized protein n=1 Tax=Tistrella arctica TaxID=3133430 RepID=A0ABU9YQE5_9PROT